PPSSPLFPLSTLPIDTELYCKYYKALNLKDLNISWVLYRKTIHISRLIFSYQLKQLTQINTFNILDLLYSFVSDGAYICYCYQHNRMFLPYLSPLPKGGIVSVAAFVDTLPDLAGILLYETRTFLYFKIYIQ
ncbi:hypothetical protein FKM95_000231, partial [Candidatus Tremblaya phenacola]